MKLFLLTIALLLISVSQSIPLATEVVYEDEVALLTPVQFSLWKHKYPFLFVLFNYPEDPTDAETTVEFSAAAKRLQTQYPGVKFARIDAPTNVSLVKQMNVTETNNIGFFWKSARFPVFYHQTRDSKSFYNWVMGFLKREVKEVTSVENAREIITNNEDVVFFLDSANSGKFHEFLGAMSSYSPMFAVNLTFYQSDEEDVRNELGIDHNREAVVIYRNYSEERNEFQNTINTENIIKFINVYRYATVMTYDKKARNRIQASQEDGIILFKSNDEAGEQALADFTLLAEKKRGEMAFVVIPAGEKDNIWQYALAIFQLTEEDFPRVGIIQGSKNMGKYLFDRELTEKNMEAWIENFANGNLTPYTRSQKIPEQDYDEADNLRVVVARNFDSVVLDESKDVMIAFYSPECPYSRAFFKVYEVFAEKLRNVDNLILAKINSDENEVPGTDTQGVPYVKFYPKNKKENPKGLGVPTAEQIIKALRKYATVDVYEELYEIETNRREKQLLKEREKEAREQKKLERAERKKQQQVNFDF